jgi:hypothetical protein
MSAIALRARLWMLVWASPPQRIGKRHPLLAIIIAVAEQMLGGEHLRRAMQAGRGDETAMPPATGEE